MAKLHENTGWCAKCTLRHDPELSICPDCGNDFPKKSQTTYCWSCRKEHWLTQHADEIENLMATGLSFNAARKAVSDTIRPTCNCCGNPIRGGKEGTRFCRKNLECRRQAEGYTRLCKTGLSPDAALAITTGRVAVFDSID